MPPSKTSVILDDGAGAAEVPKAVGAAPKAPESTVDIVEEAGADDGGPKTSDVGVDVALAKIAGCFDRNAEKPLPCEANAPNPPALDFWGVVEEKGPGVVEPDLSPKEMVPKAGLPNVGDCGEPKDGAPNAGGFVGVEIEPNADVMGETIIGASVLVVELGTVDGGDELTRVG